MKTPTKYRVVRLSGCHVVENPKGKIVAYFECGGYEDDRRRAIAFAKKRNARLCAS